MSLLEVREALAGYGAREVLHGVSLSVSPGELVAVLGPNGAGKSTLIRACLGLLPLRGGEVKVAGRSVSAYGRRELATRVAWVPQSIDGVAGFTGLELVSMGRAPHLSWWGLLSARDVERARAAMEELGIAHLANRSATEMSGGERRLLYLARALVQQAELLLLDEPTAFLDVRHQVECLERVRAQTKRGLGALAVLHDVNLAASFADRAVLMKDGRVLRSGPASEVLASESLRELYGIPMAQAECGAQRLFAPHVER